MDWGGTEQALTMFSAKKYLHYGINENEPTQGTSCTCTNQPNVDGHLLRDCLGARIPKMIGGAKIPLLFHFE
jgi:hypothetical protein